MALFFAIGHISGGHFNPAVTVGLLAGGRVSSNTAVGYIAHFRLRGCDLQARAGGLAAMAIGLTLTAIQSTRRAAWAAPCSPAARR